MDVTNLVEPHTQIGLLVAALRMGAALFLGGAIGLEREAGDHSAGLRTHMLIALAACLFTLMGLELLALPEPEDGRLRMDPLRLIEAVTAGVAFLGAGVVFRSGDTVKNLTTGASLWLAGAVGLACGAGYVAMAAVAVTLTLLVLAVLKRLGRRIGDG